jgi:hypothetical protein
VKIFGKSSYPSLARAKKWIGNAGRSFDVQSLQSYHYELLVQKGFDQPTVRMLTEGPPTYANDDNDGSADEGSDEEADEVVPRANLENRTDRSNHNVQEELHQVTRQLPALLTLENPQDPSVSWEKMISRLQTKCENCPITVWNPHTQQNSPAIQAQLSTFSPANFIPWSQLKKLGMEQSLKTDKTKYIHESDGTIHPAMGYVKLYYSVLRSDATDDDGRPLTWNPEPEEFLVCKTSNSDFTIGSRIAAARLASDVVGYLPAPWQEQIAAYMNPRQLEASRDGA